MKYAILLLSALALGACVATPPPVATGPIATSQSFGLPDGSVLTVTRQGQQARLTYPATYRLTDAEAVSYLEDGTGCRPGALLNSGFDDYSGQIVRNYGLNCG
jgi:hypothetical protein